GRLAGPAPDGDALTPGGERVDIDLDRRPGRRGAAAKLKRGVAIGSWLGARPEASDAEYHLVVVAALQKLDVAGAALQHAPHRRGGEVRVVLVKEVGGPVRRQGPVDARYLDEDAHRQLFPARRECDRLHEPERVHEMFEDVPADEQVG